MAKKKTTKRDLISEGLDEMRGMPDEGAADVAPDRMPKKSGKGKKSMPKKGGPMPMGKGKGPAMMVVVEMGKGKPPKKKKGK